MRTLWIGCIVLLAGCAEKMYPEKFSIFPEVNGETVYTDTVITEGICMDTLYGHAWRWMTNELVQRYNVHLPKDSGLYRNVLSRYLITDSSTGYLAARMTMPVNFPKDWMNYTYNPWDVYFIVEVVVQNGAYKYEVHDINVMYTHLSDNQDNTGNTAAEKLFDIFYPNTNVSTTNVGNRVPNSLILEFRKKNVVAFYKEIDLRIRVMIQSMKDAMYKKRIAAPFDKTYCGN